jgi:hypothetical protein
MLAIATAAVMLLKLDCKKLLYLIAYQHYNPSRSSNKNQDQTRLYEKDKPTGLN